jgi:hypothetical protein
MNYEKDNNASRGRRQFITHIINMQNNSASDVQSLGAGQADYNASPFRNLRDGSIVGGNAPSVIQAKRKKFRELLYGGSLTRGNTGNYIEKETL